MATTDPFGTPVPSEPGLREKAQRTAHDVSDFAKAKAEDVRHAAEQATDEVMKFIGARPVASVLAGAAVGYLLGWIAARAVQQRLAARRAARSTRRIPLEHERLVQLREFPSRWRPR